MAEIAALIGCFLLLVVVITAYAAIEISRHRALVHIAELAAKADAATRPEEDSE